MDGGAHMTVRVTIEGLADLNNFFEIAPQAARRAARLAINDTARRVAVGESIREMQEQVAFPPGYLQDPNRFGVARFATEDNLAAAIVARQRPTSLARFTSARSPGGKQGVRVRVNPGRTREMGRAFLIRLRSGSAELGNLGLAVRLRPGETLANKREVVAKSMGNGLYLLYGPSIDQVFRSVAEDVSPRVADALATQFLRQFARETGGRDA